MEYSEEIFGSNSEGRISFLEHPFVKLIFPLILGILLARFFPVCQCYGFIALFITVVLILLLSFGLIGGRLSLVFLLLVIFLIGLQQAVNKIYTYDKLKPGINIYVGDIVSEPKKSDRTVSYEVVLLAEREGDKWIRLNDRIVLYVPKKLFSDSSHRLFVYGDRIIFSARVSQVRNYGNPLEFNYKGYLNHRGIYYSAYAYAVKFISSGHGGFLMYFAHHLRRLLMDLYKKFGLAGQEFAVVSALTLGYRRGLSRQTVQSFAHSGAMHILAVSGLHVGLIFSLLYFPMRKYVKRKYWFLTVGVIIFVLWMFAMLTGFSPSVRRSATMFSLIALGEALNRKANVYNILFASAFLMLMFFPQDLYSAGFYLSYSAVLAIVYFQPKIYRIILFRSKLMRKLWGLMSVSIAAQIGTMPLGLYFFHQFPNYFLFTNLVVIPVATVILYVAMMFFAFSWFAPAGKVLIFLLKKVSWFLLWFVHHVQNLPYSYTDGVYISVLQLVILYLVIFLLVIYLKYKKFYAFALSLSLIFSFFLIQKSRVDDIRSNKLIIYNLPGKNAVVGISDGKAFVLTDMNTKEYKKFEEFYLKPLIKFAHVKSCKRYNYASNFLIGNFYYKYHVLFYKKQRILFFNSQLATEYEYFDGHFTFDTVVLLDNVKVNLAKLVDIFRARVYIFDSSNSLRRVRQWVKQAEDLGLVCRDIRLDGAYILNL